MPHLIAWSDFENWRKALLAKCQTVSKIAVILEVVTLSTNAGEEFWAVGIDAEYTTLVKRKLDFGTGVWAYADAAKISKLKSMLAIDQVTDTGIKLKSSGQHLLEPTSKYDEWSLCKLSTKNQMTARKLYQTLSQSGFRHCAHVSFSQRSQLIFEAYKRNQRYFKVINSSVDEFGDFHPVLHAPKFDFMAIDFEVIASTLARFPNGLDIGDVAVSAAIYTSKNNTLYSLILVTDLFTQPDTHTPTNPDVVEKVEYFTDEYCLLLRVSEIINSHTRPFFYCTYNHTFDNLFFFYRCTFLGVPHDFYLTPNGITLNLFMINFDLFYYIRRDYSKILPLNGTAKMILGTSKKDVDAKEIRTVYNLINQRKTPYDLDTKFEIKLGAYLQKAKMAKLSNGAYFYTNEPIEREEIVVYTLQNLIDYVNEDTMIPTKIWHRENLGDNLFARCNSMGLTMGEYPYVQVNNYLEIYTLIETLANGYFYAKYNPRVMVEYTQIVEIKNKRRKVKAYYDFNEFHSIRGKKMALIGDSLVDYLGGFNYFSGQTHCKSAIVMDIAAAYPHAPPLFNLSPENSIVCRVSELKLFAKNQIIDQTCDVYLPSEYRNFGNDDIFDKDRKDAVVAETLFGWRRNMQMLSLDELDDFDDKLYVVVARRKESMLGDFFNQRNTMRDEYKTAIKQMKAQLSKIPNFNNAMPNDVHLEEIEAIFKPSASLTNVGMYLDVTLPDLSTKSNEFNATLHKYINNTINQKIIPADRGMKIICNSSYGCLKYSAPTIASMIPNFVADVLPQIAQVGTTMNPGSKIIYMDTDSVIWDVDNCASTFDSDAVEEWCATASKGFFKLETEKYENVTVLKKKTYCFKKNGVYDTRGFPKDSCAMYKVLFHNFNKLLWEDYSDKPFTVEDNIHSFFKSLFNLIYDHVLADRKSILFKINVKEDLNYANENQYKRAIERLKKFEPAWSHGRRIRYFHGVSSTQPNNYALADIHVEPLLNHTKLQDINLFTIFFLSKVQLHNLFNIKYIRDHKMLEKRFVPCCKLLYTEYAHNAYFKWRTNTFPQTK